MIESIQQSRSGREVPGGARSSEGLQETTWYTSGLLDFTSITLVGHASEFITGSIAYFTIIGTASGSSGGIQGVYSGQNQIVLQQCLTLAAQLNLSRRTNINPLLRIQVEPDPTNTEFARIQYCTLYE